MALTESRMMPLGTQLPKFSLPDVVSDENVDSSAFAGNPVLVAFICNHCPYVIHIADAFAQCTKKYIDAGVAVVAISSNDVLGYPADSPEKMKEEVKLRGYTFPYLYDESQQTAKAFTAACTPDFFLFNKNHQLVYRGRFDDSRPTRVRSGVYKSDHLATGEELNTAITEMLNGNPAPSPQHPSLGCNIKWKDN